MVMARGAGRHRRRLRTASSARCRCGILEGSIFCGYKFTKLGNKGDNSMRRSTISVFVVTAWLLGVAIPAAAADPALNLLLKKGVITQQEYDEALKETGQAAEAPPAKGGPRSTTQLYDAYLTFKQIPWANLRVGQYRTHFGRQEFMSSALLQFVDRGFVAEAFVPNAIDRRDQGVTIFSDQEKHPVNYAFGVFNGVGINLNRLSLSTPGNANELMYVGRITADLMGKPGYPEGDLAYSLTPQMAVGVSYGYNAGLQTNTLPGPGVNNQV